MFIISQSQDDKNDMTLTLEELLPSEPVKPITYDNLFILLGTEI